MSTLTGKTCAAKHRPPCASKNGHEGVVKLLGLWKGAITSIVWCPGSISFPPASLKLKTEMLYLITSPC